MHLISGIDCRDSVYSVGNKIYKSEVLKYCKTPAQASPPSSMYDILDTAEGFNLLGALLKTFQAALEPMKLNSTSVE